MPVHPHLADLAVFRLAEDGAASVHALSSAAAAGSIGFINSVGNLGGFMGPFVLGTVEKLTGSFMGGLFFLTACMALSSVTVFWLGRSDVAGSGRGAADVQPSPREAGQSRRLATPSGRAPYDAQRLRPDRASPRPRC